MKGIVLRDFEVRRLASAGSVLIWRKADIIWDTSKHWGNYDCWTFRKAGKPLIGFTPTNGGDAAVANHCPHGRTGEIRFVKETWRSWDEEQRIIYKSDYQPIEMKMRWLSPATMPSWASRFRVTLSVSCRQIRSVTEEEAVRSGCRDAVGNWKPRLQACFYARNAFSQIIYRGSPGSWERNEWHWAIEAKEVK